MILSDKAVTGTGAEEEPAGVCQSAGSPRIFAVGILEVAAPVVPRTNG